MNRMMEINPTSLVLTRGFSTAAAAGDAIAIGALWLWDGEGYALLL